MSSKNKDTHYRVLARKYRPQSFEELIGQDSLVRTLKNAINSGRIAHAYMLTGIRGTGKTTTARLIAKALNYVGPDGSSSPTAGPTDDCTICQAITEDRHPDVLEMDAATRTGVDDIREILDGVRYAPTEARFKVYIIDEVHMLSKSAFNALLKTLEEPPEHVKFIFATTEIRKVPVTILSRCQRFDLRRIDTETLSDYYKLICEKEEVDVDDEALFMIARAADGSVRDGLSLLDQAIALSKDKISLSKVQEMLGMADKIKILDMLEKILEGDSESALALMDDLHKNGADSLYVLQDMLSYIHLLTRLKAVPDLAHYKNLVSADLAERLKELSSNLSMPTLGKSWQILLKGINEVNHAPNMQEASEMVIIRLLYASNLPDPHDLLKKLQASNEDDGVSSINHSNALDVAPSIDNKALSSVNNVESSYTGNNTAAALKIQTDTSLEQSPQSLEDIVSLLELHKEVVLASQLYYHAHLVKLGTYRLELYLEPEAQPNLLLDLRKFLVNITGQQWMISTSKQKGAPTLFEQKQQKEKESILRAQKNPLVSEVMKAFPDAELKVTKKN